MFTFSVCTALSISRLSSRRQQHSSPSSPSRDSHRRGSNNHRQQRSVTPEGLDARANTTPDHRSPSARRKRGDDWDSAYDEPPAKRKKSRDRSKDRGGGGGGGAKEAKQQRKKKKKEKNKAELYRILSIRIR